VTEGATGVQVSTQLIVVNPRVITSSVTGVAITPKLIEIQPTLIKVKPVGVNVSPTGKALPANMLHLADYYHQPQMCPSGFWHFILQFCVPCKATATPHCRAYTPR